MSTTESITGATNRARAALSAVPEADYGIGIEGGLEEVGGRWFTAGWVVAVHKAGGDSIGIGSSARIEVSVKVLKEIRSGKELGTVMDEFSGKSNVKQHAGMFGLLTNGAVSRTAGYEQAVCFALSRFCSPKYF